MPLNTPDTALPGDTLSDTLKSAGASDTGSPASPTTVPVSMPTGLGRTLQVLSGGNYDPTGGQDSSPASPSSKPTKFGMLMKVLGPALEGGLIGLAGGKGHPQGGFGAANDFYNRQRAYQMQQTLLARSAYNDQFRNLLEAARTQHLLAQPNFNGRGAAPIKGRDADGNLVYMRPNPQTGVYEPIEGLTPDEADNSKAEMTDQGLVSVNPRTATARLVRLPTRPPSGAVEGTPTGNIEPSEFDSGSPRIPLTPGIGGIPSATALRASTGNSTIPLHAPNFGKPKPTIRASRNAAGVEQDHMIDTDPDSPTFGKDLGTTGTSRQPLPDRAANRENGRDAQKADDVARSESYAGAALAKSGGDPDKAIQSLNALKFSDPKVAKDFNRLLPQIRKSITDRSKKRVKSTNPFGMNDQDWQSLTSGGSTQPNQDDEQ